MKKHIRILLLGVVAILALGTLTACSSGTKEATDTTEAAGTSAAPAPATASPFPQSAKYIADVKSADGKPMVIGIAVDGTQIAASAGMYTAELNGVRASWVVRPDGSATGVQFNGGISGRDFEQAELQQLNELQFRNSVRNKRQLQQAQQIQVLANRSARSTINGQDVTPVVVDGNFRL